MSAGQVAPPKDRGLHINITLAIDQDTDAEALCKALMDEFIEVVEANGRDCLIVAGLDEYNGYTASYTPLTSPGLCAIDLRQNNSLVRSD